MLYCLILSGCAGETGPVDAPAPFSGKVSKSAITADCIAVQDAAEKYAEQCGEYPGDMEIEIDSAIDVQTCVAPELPDGNFPEGPITEWVEIPRGMERIYPDAIEYTIIRFKGWNLGYIVIGYGADGPVIELTSGESREETVVRLNCLIVRAAVEAFAALNGGEYPEDTDTDRTPCGSTVLDLLPRGHLCRNPYTGAETTPVNHSPVDPGEIGYTAIQDIYYYNGYQVRGRMIGYIISGHGTAEIVCVINNRGYSSRDALVIQNCLTVERAARLFARCNGGWYPLNSADSDPSGKTIIDYLPGGTLLRNPYTGLLTEPVDGVACIEGSTGYCVVAPRGICVGYGITGAGKNGEQICTLWHGPPDTDGH
jgi:hypothetical protein